MTTDDTFALDIAWDEGKDLPSLVGPFTTREEAEKWAELNTPNGVANVRRLAWPYLRANPAT
jgi:hypothetical protein